MLMPLWLAVATKPPGSGCKAQTAQERAETRPNTYPQLIHRCPHTVLHPYQLTVQLGGHLPLNAWTAQGLTTKAACRAATAAAAGTTIGEGSNMTQRPCMSACNDTRTHTSWPAKHPQHPATAPCDCRTPWKKPTICTQILTNTPVLAGCSRERAQIATQWSSGNARHCPAVPTCKQIDETLDLLGRHTLSGCTPLHGARQPLRSAAHNHLQESQRQMHLACNTHNYDECDGI